MKPFYKYLISLMLFLAITYISALAFINVLPFKEMATLFHLNKTIHSKTFSNKEGGATHTFFYNDISSIQVDFLIIDNSFQLEINDKLIHQNILELELNELSKEDVHLVFASDGEEVLAPWIANKNKLPRLRLVINHLGKISMEGTRDIHSSELEKIQLSDQSKFNAIDTFKEQTKITITNVDERGLDAMKGKIMITKNRTTQKNKTNAI